LLARSPKDDDNPVDSRHVIPRYAELPICADAPPNSAWGVFGRDDQLGTLNFLTPERRVNAARLAKRGTVFNLDLPLHLPARPFFAARKRPQHVIDRWANSTVQDDHLDGFFPQFSSQWDGLRHIRHPDYGFYNWTSIEDAHAVDGRLGIQNFARHGIVGRGVLLDVARYFAARGTALPPDQFMTFSPGLLDNVATAQRVELNPGDIVMLRTGMAAMLRAEADRGEFSDEPRTGFACPGLDQGEDSLAWLWDHQVAALVGDNLAVEAFPFNREKKVIHHWGIAMLGLVLGELFDLEDLAADCAEDGVYECFFVAKPLMLRGGVGSPANAMAIK
jgi:kynurenine formamidase